MPISSINGEKIQAFNAPVSFTSNQTCNLDELTEVGIYSFGWATGESRHESWPESPSGVVTVTKNPAGSVTYQTFIVSATGNIWTRLKGSTGWRAWVKSGQVAGSVSTGMLANGAVTSSKLASGAAMSSPTSGYTPNQTQDLDELTTAGVYTFSLASGSAYHESWPETRSPVATLIVTKNPNNAIVHQTLIQDYYGMVYTRILASNAWRAWADMTTQPREISILFVGNSLTQDGIAYVPWLIRHFFPNIRFKFYMWYNGGKTLAQHYQYFVNDTPCETFSVAENKNNWTNYNNSKTMASILSEYEFDIVCLQEYFNYKSSYTEADLQDINNCIDYIRSHHCSEYKMLKFVSLFHAPLRSNADTVYQRTKDGNALILKKTVVDDMIPNGMAVYRALSTDLDSLGDQGHLSPDGTHTQEGLPCLLQSWVTMLWLFERLGINESIYGTTWKMSTSVFNTINVPGPNLGSGVVVGTTAQNILAQEVAIRAFKEGKKFVNDNLWAD